LNDTLKFEAYTHINLNVSPIMFLIKV